MSLSNWKETAVAPDRTHHLRDGEPLYDERFEEVLKYHAPGLAPSRDGSGSFHIDLAGKPAYAARYQGTFGFYDGRASVASEDGWFHIRASGEPLYSERYAWTGNYQGGRCTVRLKDGHYCHIDRQGRPVYDEVYRYAGDFRNGVAVVQNDEGKSTHIDRDGRLAHGRWFDDLDVFHKGFARARDERGWHHVDRAGNALYGRRFAEVEPFYNGQARTKRFDGGLEVIDERGERVLELRPGKVSPLQSLSDDMVGFWKTQTIQAGVELGVFDALPASTTMAAQHTGLSERHATRLLRGLWELDLVRPDGAGRPWPVVLHDWSDADALRILRRARQSLRPGGRLYVIEMVLSEEHPGGSLLDLNMLVMTGGRERTRDDWTRLFTEAGFELLETLALPSVSDILIGGLK